MTYHGPKRPRANDQKDAYRGVTHVYTPPRNTPIPVF